MINANEIQTAKDCISFALENGADAVRVYLSKSGIDSCNILNGELDKVTHSADRSIYFYLYVDGKYGTYSTNRLVIDELKEFILNGIAMTRMLGEDPCRKLPEPCRTAQDAKTGREMGLYDDSMTIVIPLISKDLKADIRRARSAASLKLQSRLNQVTNTAVSGGTVHAGTMSSNLRNAAGWL